MGFPGGSDGKESTCNAGDAGFFPGSGRSPGEGNAYPLQYSCLENFKNLRKWNKLVISKLKKKSDQDFLVVQWLRHHTLNAGGLGSIPGLGRSPGEGNAYPLQYSCLENSMNRRALWATVHRVAESDMTERLTL